MSSREIAEVVEKRHDNVRRTIEMLVRNGAIRSPQSEVSEEINNLGLKRKVHHYRVNQRDSYVIVAQLSPEFTELARQRLAARLVDRWQELEKQVAQPKVPQSFAEALRLAADTQEQLEQAEQEKQVAQPKVPHLQPERPRRHRHGHPRRRLRRRAVVRGEGCARSPWAEHSGQRT